MPPALHEILNGGAGGYDVSGLGRTCEVQEEVQHLFLVIIYSIYAVSLFNRGRPKI